MRNDTARTQGEHLAALRARLDTVVARVHALCDTLGSEQLLWRPAPEKWGIADCLEHLIKADALYSHVFETAIARDPVPSRDAAMANRAKPFRTTLLSRFGIWIASPDGPRVPAPTAFVPPPARPDAPARFYRSQADWRDLIDRVDGHDIQRLSVMSPLTSVVRLPMGSMLEVMIAHQERHTDQAGRVRGLNPLGT